MVPRGGETEFKSIRGLFRRGMQKSSTGSLSFLPRLSHWNLPNVKAQTEVAAAHTLRISKQAKCAHLLPFFATLGRAAALDRGSVFSGKTTLRPIRASHSCSGSVIRQRRSQEV